MPSDTQRPRVSVVLATYNGAEYLEAQLQSLLIQTRPIDDIVITDDASTDGTPAILRRFGERLPDSCLILLNQDRLGVGGNFERGLRHATGDIVLLADQDDVWLPEKVDRFVGAMEQDPSVSAVYCDAQLTKSGSSRLRGTTLWQSVGLGPRERDRIRQGDIASVLLKRTLAFGTVMGVRRDVVQSSLPFPDDWPHDGYLAWVAAARGSAALIEEPLVTYRQHSNQQSGGTIRHGSGSSARASMWRVVADRLSNLDVPEERRSVVDRLVAEAQTKAAHLDRRERVRNRRRANRVSEVFDEGRRRGYQRYSNGMSSMILDLMASPTGRSDSADVTETWTLVYRYCEGQNKKGRPEFFSKGLALASFARSVRACAVMPAVTFVVDGPPVREDIRALMESLGSIVHIERGNNSRSYLDALDIAISAGTSWVYLSEDDYLYREEAFSKLSAAHEVLAQQAYITLYDHPDRYTGADLTPARVLFSGDHHWRGVGSTCMSFAAPRSALRRDRWVHLACSQKPSPMDFLMWRLLVHPTGRRSLVRRRTIFGPVRSLATHLESAHLAPGIDWDTQAAEVRAWAQVEYGIDV